MIPMSLNWPALTFFLKSQSRLLSCSSVVSISVRQVLINAALIGEVDSRQSTFLFKLKRVCCQIIVIGQISPDFKFHAAEHRPVEFELDFIRCPQFYAYGG